MPLGNLPNATNSPFREAVVPGTKRPRAEAGFEKQPPAKKQAIEAEDAENRRQVVARKLANATGANGTTRRVASGARTTGTKVASHENLNEIRQWQKHYKKLFPTMVFYYDNVPDETRHKIGKQLQLLGSVSDMLLHIHSHSLSFYTAHSRAG